MRLINADKLIDALYEQQNKNRYENHNDEWNIGLEQAVEMINVQPEVFNIEKVVEQLEDEKIRSYANITEYGEKIGKDLDDCDWFYCGLVRAIEIVKAGGQND